MYVCVRAGRHACMQIHVLLYTDIYACVGESVPFRYAVKLENFAGYSRKFLFEHFPTRQGCRRAALAYLKETTRVLTIFDSFRGKARFHRKLHICIYKYASICNLIHMHLASKGISLGLLFLR